MDGLALGISFSGGHNDIIISTLVAIIAHEIPQEIGDTGILLKCGFTPKQVLIFNGLANLSALLGALIGLVIGEFDETLVMYMYGFIAANFIYIAASDMMPYLLKE